MTKKINTPIEPDQEIVPDEQEIECEKNNYVKKLELQRLILNRLVDSNLQKNPTNKEIDQLCSDANESLTNE